MQSPGAPVHCWVRRASLPEPASELNPSWHRAGLWLLAGVQDKLQEDDGHNCNAARLGPALLPPPAGGRSLLPLPATPLLFGRALQPICTPPLQGTRAFGGDGAASAGTWLINKICPRISSTIRAAAACCLLPPPLPLAARRSSPGLGGQHRILHQQVARVCIHPSIEVALATTPALPLDALH